MEQEPYTENPVTASVQRLRQEFDRWLETAMSQGGKALNALGLRGTRPWYPAVDVVETPESVCVSVNLPGVDPAAVDVSIAGNMLTIKGESPEPTLTDRDVAHVRQRNHGLFERSIPMPAPVDADRVNAEVKQGVLTVRLAKAERTLPRQIPVRGEEAHGT
jgi:HSP20 family protein